MAYYRLTFMFCSTICIDDIDRDTDIALTLSNPYIRRLINMICQNTKMQMFACYLKAYFFHIFCLLLFTCMCVQIYTLHLLFVYYKLVFS